MNTRKYSIEVESFDSYQDIENASSSFYTEQQLDCGSSCNQEISMSKTTTLKNLLIISLGYALFFTGFAALSNLQSTMNAWQNYGIVSQAIIYLFAMLSALLLPKIVIRKLGCKRTFVLTIALNSLYIAANFYPSNVTLFSSAALFGLTAGPLGTAQNLYVMEMAARYAAQAMDTTQHTSAMFFGIFAFFSANTQIWGNVISYFILTPNIHLTTETPGVTSTLCGIHFDYSYAYSNDSINTHPNLQPPSDEKRNLLVGVFTALGIAAAVMMAIWLDPLRNDTDKHSNKGDTGALAHAFAALRNMTTFNQLLLLPIGIFVGQEIAFYQADFTQAFIACYCGIPSVGFVSICFGASSALLALAAGTLVKQFSQTAVICAAALLNTLGCVLMLLWTTSLQGVPTLFLTAAIWGAADALWWSQVPALYSEVFVENKEAGFSNFWFWSYFGYFVSFASASHLSTAAKICVLLVFLNLGLAGVLYLCARRRSSYQSMT